MWKLGDSFRKVLKASRSRKQNPDELGNEFIIPKTDVVKFAEFLQSRKKIVKLHCYIHEAMGGTNATVWDVGRTAITEDSPTMFGQVRVLDNVITAGPGKESEKLGRAQGMISSTGMEECAVTMNLNLWFTNGEFSGSALCLVGRNPIDGKDREVAVVGGTGAFRMARGYAVCNSYSYDIASNYGVVEYSIFVVAYSQDD